MSKWKYLLFINSQIIYEFTKRWKVDNDSLKQVYSFGYLFTYSDIQKFLWGIKNAWDICKDFKEAVEEILSMRWHYIDC